MNTINRIDQAVLLLRDRLEKLGTRTDAARGSGAAAVQGRALDPLSPLRDLARQGQVSGQELRRALVRMLLADAFGEEASGSLEFQSIADQVTGILEGNEAGRELLDRALAELG